MKADDTSNALWSNALFAAIVEKQKSKREFKIRFQEVDAKASSELSVKMYRACESCIAESGMRRGRGFWDHLKPAKSPLAPLYAKLQSWNVDRLKRGVSPITWSWLVEKHVTHVALVGVAVNMASSACHADGGFDVSSCETSPELPFPYSGGMVAGRNDN